MENLAVLVLAAGKSSRMKNIKQLLKIKNKTLLDITLETAKNIFSANTIFCVLGAHAKKIQQEITTKNINFVYNRNFESGLSSSIVAGIHHIKKENINFDGVLILLADQLDVSVAYLNKLIISFQENNQKIIASNYSNKAGVPAIFPKKHFSYLLHLKGDKGAKDFLHKHAQETIIIRNEFGFKDIDTKEDYKSYLKSN